MVINESSERGYIVSKPEGTINLNLNVKRPIGTGWRMWIAGKLIRAAELIAKQKIKFNITTTTEKPETADSILRKAGKR